MEKLIPDGEKLRGEIVSDLGKKTKKASSSSPNESELATGTGKKNNESKPINNSVKLAKTNFITLILVFILLLILTAGSWLTFQMQAQLKDNAVKLDSLEDVVYRTAKSLDVFSVKSKKFESIQDELIRSTDDHINSLQLQLTAQGARLAELGSTSRSDWYLSEAAYLVRLASQRLQTERSTKNPLALLLQADRILLNLNEEGLLSVRTAIADDVASLRLAGSVDVEGIVLELNALTKQINQLELLQLSLDSSETNLDEEIVGADGVHISEITDTSLDSLTEQFKRHLASVVKVRERKGIIEPALSYSEESVVRSNLKLFLHQAANSVLREEQAIFELSLKNALDLLRIYFSDTSSSRQINSRISHLKELTVVQMLPDINGSISAIETFIIVRQSGLIKADASEIIDKL